MPEIPQDLYDRYGGGGETIEVSEEEAARIRKRAFHDELRAATTPDEGARVLEKYGMRADQSTSDPDPTKPPLDPSEEADERIAQANKSGDMQAVQRELWKAGRLEVKPDFLAQEEHDAFWGMAPR